jgi:hypothetical protein
MKARAPAHLAGHTGHDLRVRMRREHLVDALLQLHDRLADRIQLAQQACRCSPIACSTAACRRIWSLLRTTCRLPASAAMARWRPAVHSNAASSVPVNAAEDRPVPVSLDRLVAGYLLLAEPDEVDLYRFRHLVAQARDPANADDQRAELLRSAPPCGGASRWPGCGGRGRLVFVRRGGRSTWTRRWCRPMSRGAPAGRITWWAHCAFGQRTAGWVAGPSSWWSLVRSCSASGWSRAVRMVRAFR